MSSDFPSRRFDPSWLLPEVGTAGESLFGARDASTRPTTERSMNDISHRDIDEALEQIGSEDCCVCPHCGAVVAFDGSVLD